MPPRRTWLFFLVIILVNFFLIRFLFPGTQVAKIPYTKFKQEAVQGNVQRIYSRGESITGRFRSAVLLPARPESPATTDSVQGPTRRVTDFSTTLPAFVDAGLETLLIAHGVEISAEPIQQDNIWISLLLSFAPALLIIALYVWIFRRASRQGGMGGLMGIGRSNARRFDRETEQRVTFDDVAGIEEAEQELVEIVDFLKDPMKYTRLGGTAP
ncbi:MAG TPA: ATP-dependent metallopeptidase FtsH/Yme1/Tma family protein, partial [Gemmatimonadales bacterium]|nr:ATP-dependent metallopeptidase FtsH/Yme1/Tma family protein [Gemmatimonadales bacterium]